MADGARALEINEDRPFQERYWRIQRIGWVIFALIVAAALAGFSGKGGPFARATISGDQGTIDYPRVTRWVSGDDIRITIPEGAGAENRIDFNAAFARVFALQGAEPAPVRSIATADGFGLIFASTPSPHGREIVLHVRALRPTIGTAMNVRIDGGAPIRFTPVVLP